MFNNLVRITILFFFLLSYPADAWNSLGHMIIANIAYQSLKPANREKVDELASYLQEEYPDVLSFLHMAFWADTLRSQKIEMFTHWHYIDKPFSTDGTVLKNIMDTDNAVWAIDNIKPIIKNTRANPYERARFLAFFIHIVGDMHQPLHTVSYMSSIYPDGDQGGNLYFVRYNSMRVKLHYLWDGGLGVFEIPINPDNIEHLTKMIMNKYPPKYFGEKINDIDTVHWSDEGMTNAKKYVYTIPREQTPSDEYINIGRKISEQQVALAGYRLGSLLNTLLSN